MKIEIGLIGDYSPEVLAHVAIPKALAIAARDLNFEVEASWLPTAEIGANTTLLQRFDALWCVPAN